jgi:hypothetical protein
MPVKRLYERAIATGLLTGDDGPPLWKRKPWRRAAEQLEIKHEQRDREWFWRLPVTENVQVPEVISQVPETFRQAPTISDVSMSDVPVLVQDDIATARRKFMEESLKRTIELAKETAPRARAAVDKYLQTGDLRDLFPTEH